VNTRAAAERMSAAEIETAVNWVKTYLQGKLDAAEQAGAPYRTLLTLGEDIRDWTQALELAPECEAEVLRAVEGRPEERVVRAYLAALAEPVAWCVRCFCDDGIPHS
jgi:hypothetical protein